MRGLLLEHSESWLTKDLDGPCSVIRQEGFCKYSLSIVQTGTEDGESSSQAYYKPALLLLLLLSVVSIAHVW